MVEESEKIKQFTLNFFKNLNCEVYWEGRVLVINKVPRNFQDFFGKNEPFRFAFKEEDLKENSELVSKGSSLIKKMNEFLDGKGQTTLVKLDIDFDEGFIRNIYPLMNCEISQIVKKRNYKPITRFVFLTNFQYLNENDQVMNAVYVKDGKVIEFDPGEYGNLEGNKRDLDEVSFEKEYEIAKHKIKEMVEPKKEEVAKRVEELLEKEIERIKKHTNSHLEELKQNIEKLKRQIKEADKLGNEEKSEKLRRQLLEIDLEKEIRDSEKEQEFFMSQEIQKHSLGIKNKLLNTTIFYYPEISFGVFLRNKRAKRIVEIIYEPIERKFSEMHCDVCKTEIKELIICSSGHLICRNCGDRCNSCQEIVCEKCSLKKCSHDDKLFCSSCINICSDCRKNFCRDHLTKSGLSGNFICRNCSTICSECHNVIERSALKEGKCIRCWSKNFGKKIFS